MKRLKSVAGDDNLCINIDDLNADFDPKEYDRRMKVDIQYLLFIQKEFILQELFNDDYYQKGGNEEDKPEVSDDELQGMKIQFCFFFSLSIHRFFSGKLGSYR